MIHGKRELLWLVVGGTLALLLYTATARGQEFGVDRPGSNLKPGFDLPNANHELCRMACDADPSCRAYTYVKPGYQGPNARCWLKNAVPAPVKNDCCISGVKKTSLTATADGCIDWERPPAGIVFGFKHSSQQGDKRFVWKGVLYNPSSAQIPPAMFTRQSGGDLTGSQGQGYYWYETNGLGFQFANTTTPVNPAESGAWLTFQNRLPAGLVLGLKHSANQPSKAFVWLTDIGGEFRPWGSMTYDPVDQYAVLPNVLERQNGGDRGGSAGTGYYWYEVKPWTSGCDSPLPGGLLFGLKHSMNQPNKTFTWHGIVYDPAHRGGPVPPGFVRCHGGDLGAPSNQGFYWFESTAGQTNLGVACGL